MNKKVFFRYQRAFALVEVTVAFVILGIIGMIVVPQFASTMRHTTDKVAQERAGLLDLAKNEYQNNIGQVSVYYWQSATNDEAKYQLLRPYLKRSLSSNNLGQGAISKDFTLEGYTYILNELTNATTIVRNRDRVSIGDR